ncbi:MAG: T9SS type A sorting domain-containing protein [Sphingobacteriales bacterium]|nr:MAG: T9SS type A sorting domain-containing protein [Sphingobacteriales bacterium]
MNYKILLTSAVMLYGAAALAQNSNKAYAITGDGNRDFVWMNIRQVDLSTGQVSKTIFQRNSTPYVLNDVATKSAVAKRTLSEDQFTRSADHPTASFVAAAALDVRSNKLYFTPMRVGELRWLDLNSKEEAPQFYRLTSPALNFGTNADESNHITRMVIAADGNGYALTNDGNHLIRFTTGKKPVITDLGNLIDAESNNGVSVHNKCTSWGGDMLADAMGKLYIISANKHVFKVDVESRIATHLGTISGLPANYTTNAAAVNADGDIVVSSANVFEGYYKVKLAELAATAISGSDKTFNASDLANGNLLLQKEYDADRKYAAASLLADNNTMLGDKRVFPNPVTASTFSVLFEDQKAGMYSIAVTDLSGRVFQTQKVNIGKSLQTQQVSLNRNTAKGLYFVKVYDEQKQIVFTEKVLIQ